MLKMPPPKKFRQKNNARKICFKTSILYYYDCRNAPAAALNTINFFFYEFRHKVQTRQNLKNRLHKINKVPSNVPCVLLRHRSWENPLWFSHGTFAGNISPRVSAIFSILKLHNQHCGTFQLVKEISFRRINSFWNTTATHLLLWRTSPHYYPTMSFDKRKNIFLKCK
jgi:hypothetical protein